MKFLGFLIFVFVFLMAFWVLLFLGSVIPYFIYVWYKEGKLPLNPAAESPSPCRKIRVLLWTAFGYT